MQKWRHLEAKLGIITNLDDIANHRNTAATSDRMEIRSMAVTASIMQQSKDDVPRFELNLELELHFHH